MNTSFPLIAVSPSLHSATDATFWRRVAGACHAARDARAAIVAARFAVERQERFGFRLSALTPAIPHVLGLACNP